MIALFESEESDDLFRPSNNRYSIVDYPYRNNLWVANELLQCLLYDCLDYMTEKRLNGVYITNIVSTTFTLLIIQNHRRRQALSITKEGLNAMGRNNKIATDNGAPE